MESYLLKNSLGTTTTSNNKKYNIGQIISASNQQYITTADAAVDAAATVAAAVTNDYDNNIKTMGENVEYEKLIRFTSKPWQYLYDAMKGRSTRNSVDTTLHCFVISVLQPYYSGNKTYVLKLCCYAMCYYDHFK